MSDRTFPLAIDATAIHVDVAPGVEIRLSGSYRMQDGSVIDAVTTSWPEGTPGGQGVDPGGFVDLKGGGFHLVSRDPVSHKVIAVATGEDAPACRAAHVAAPCLPLRTIPLAQSRLLMKDELRSSMSGAITVELTSAPPIPVEPAASPVNDVVRSPFVIGGACLAAAVGVGAIVWMARKRRKLSPEGRLRDLVARVQKKLGRADSDIFAALGPVVKKTLAIVNDKRVDPKSKEGQRVVELLVRVESRLDATVEQARADKERAAADELVLEMETALEAASEVARL